MRRPPPRAWIGWAWAKAELPAYPLDRRTIAFHEAAHAVLSHMLSLPITGAEISSASETSAVAGIVRMDNSVIGKRAAVAPDDIPLPVLKSAAIELATMYVAGTMAELRLHELDVGGWLGLHCTDFTNARCVLWEAFGSDRPLYYCQCLASYLLVEHWPWVERVANRLITAGAVTPDEIAAAREGAA